MTGLRGRDEGEKPKNSGSQKFAIELCLPWLIVEECYKKLSSYKIIKISQ